MPRDDQIEEVASIAEKPPYRHHKSGAPTTVLNPSIGPKDKGPLNLLPIAREHNQHKQIRNHGENDKPKHNIGQPHSPIANGQHHHLIHWQEQEKEYEG